MFNKPTSWFWTHLHVFHDIVLLVSYLCVRWKVSFKRWCPVDWWPSLKHKLSNSKFQSFSLQKDSSFYKLDNWDIDIFIFCYCSELQDWNLQNPKETKMLQKIFKFLIMKVKIYKIWQWLNYHLMSFTIIKIC